MHKQLLNEPSSLGGTVSLHVYIVRSVEYRVDQNALQHRSGLLVSIVLWTFSEIVDETCEQI